MDYLYFAAGTFVGAFTVCLWTRTRSTAGTLRIDCSDPNKDLYRFEIDDLGKLSKKKRIVLKVDSTADLSQN